MEHVLINNLEGGTDDDPVAQLNRGVTTGDDNHGLLVDNGDLGPAPLQNNIAPHETFEGTVNVADPTATLNDADEASRILENMLNNVHMSAGGTTATLPHSSVLPTDGFANVNLTEHAWARAFPTMFMPDCINSQWVIMNDITASPHPRERNIAFNDWLQHQSWRHDGVPAAHPTFDSVTLNHKRKFALQSQARVVINSEAAASKHSMCGRAFETSMLMCETVPCNCCGRTQPYVMLIHISH